MSTNNTTAANFRSVSLMPSLDKNSKTFEINRLSLFTFLVKLILMEKSSVRFLGILVLNGTNHEINT